jgi:thymidine kinase
MELGPKEIKYKRAVCDVCKSPEAIYTQVFKRDEVITSGMPPVIPDDGTYTYSVACRKCFVKGKN